MGRELRRVRSTRKISGSYRLVRLVPTSRLAAIPLRAVLRSARSLRLNGK